MNYSNLDEILSKYDHFHTLSELHKGRLIKLVNGVLCGEYKHTELLPTKEIGSVSLHSNQLYKWFRKKNDDGYYKKVIQHYFDVVNESYQFGKGKGYTKKFKLKEWIYDLCIEKYKNPKPIELSSIIDGVKPITVIPTNGVHPLDINGNPKSSTIEINPIVEPNIQNLEMMIEELENSKSISIREHIREKYLFQLYQLRQTLNNTICPRGLLQLYQESGNGRLNPMIGLDFPHLIHTQNRIRQVLFSGMDLYDYDMSNSHLSIFYGLCKKYGMDCPFIGDYLTNKPYYREKWSYDYCVKEKIIKKYIISWLYGNTMSEVSDNPYYKVLGYERMIRMKSDTVLVGIYNEIISGRKLIVNHHSTVNGTVINVMKKESQTKRMKSKLCFILFGYESKILEIINQLIGQSMKVLIYDGWIGSKTDVSILEKTIKQKLNLDIRFDEELIEKPSISELF